MSWDIFIQDLPAVPSANAIPADFRPGTIGRRDDLRSRIMEVVPFAVQQDTDWLFAKGDDIDLSMQFHMEDAANVRYILVHIHGGAQSAACVAAILQHLGLRALDTRTSAFFDGDGLEESL